MTVHKKPQSLKSPAAVGNNNATRSANFDHFSIGVIGGGVVLPRLGILHYVEDQFADIRILRRYAACLHAPLQKRPSVRFGVNLLPHCGHWRSDLRKVRSSLALAVSSAPRHLGEQIARFSFQRLGVNTGRAQCSQFCSRKTGIFSSHMGPDLSKHALQNQARTPCPTTGPSGNR